MQTKPLILLVFLASLSACDQQAQKPVSIAINPWPGYELMYLAEVKGFFEQAGAKVKLVQLDSLSDVQRAYLNGHVDGMASTLIETVQATHLGSNPLKIIMIPDYSNGGDMLIGSSQIETMQDLKGKKVGAEVSSLGIYILQRALAKHGLSLEDVEVINTKQEEGLAKLLSGDIDGFVTYPPFSVEILKHKQFRTVFTSAEIPFEIIDTVSLSEAVIDNNPAIVKQLRNAWQLAMDYMKSNPEDAYKIMADREGISVQEFKDTLADLLLLSLDEQMSLFMEQNRLREATFEVCNTLHHVNAITADCNNQPNIVSSQ